MPLVGTWIEISATPEPGLNVHVVPLVGTWIEINEDSPVIIFELSCPSWARGLKFVNWGDGTGVTVVPLVGTWIEILTYGVH